MSAEETPVAPEFMACSIPFAALTVASLFLDYIGAMSGSWLFIGTMVGIAATIAALLAIWTPRIPPIAAFCGFVMVMIALHRYDLTPVKPYRRFFDHIANGMSRDQVVACLAYEFPVGGRYKVPTYHWHDDEWGPRLTFGLDRKDGRYDAEVIQVYFIADRVHRKEYHPD